MLADNAVLVLSEHLLTISLIIIDNQNGDDHASP